MDFDFSEEQQLLAETVQRFMRESYSFEQRRTILESSAGWSRDIWHQLAEFGLTALNVPEAHGGMGAGPVDTLLAMEALGGGLLLEPFLGAAVLAPTLIAQSNDAAAMTDLLPTIARGERIVIVAHEEAGARGASSQVTTRAQRRGDVLVVDGHKSVVMHAPCADELLVSARIHGTTDATDGIVILRIEPGQPGVALKSYRTIDGLRAADITLSGVEVPAERLMGTESNGFTALQAAHDIALSALCAEAVGLMKVMQNATVEYTKQRKQFGQPIGRFQALQHRMADMLIQTEQAQSMSYLAAMRCTSDDLAVRRRTLAAAKTLIGQAGRFVAQQAVQLHGGMGMTDELMVSHGFKRLTAIDLTWGDADFHLREFASAL